MSSAVTERGGYSHLAWLLGDLFFTMYRAWCCCAGVYQMDGMINGHKGKRRVGGRSWLVSWNRVTLLCLTMVADSVLGQGATGMGAYGKGATGMGAPGKTV